MTILLSDSEFCSTYLLVNVILLIFLQAADWLSRVRKGRTLRVVLWAPEAILPQLVTFCKMVRWKHLLKTRIVQISSVCESQFCCKTRALTTCCNEVVMHVCTLLHNDDLLINKWLCNKRKGNHFQIVKQMAAFLLCHANTYVNTPTFFQGTRPLPTTTYKRILCLLLSFLHVKIHESTIISTLKKSVL